MTDLEPQHHLIYAAQSLGQADEIFWRHDADRDAARYLVSVAQAHAAIAAALFAAPSTANPPQPGTARGEE